VEKPALTVQNVTTTNSRCKISTSKVTNFDKNNDSNNAACHW